MDHHPRQPAPPDRLSTRSRIRTLLRGLLLPAMAAAMPVGCGESGPPGATVARDTVGDTVVVRTLSGSAWGGVATLEPEVRIGVFEGEDVYMFGRVRSLAVSRDGAIYVMDSQVPALRKYLSDGQFEATFGREGEGPGEYRGPDGGLAVLPDGRVVLRDPRNARLQLFTPSGEPAGTWPIRGNFNTSNPLVVDTAGRVYTQVLLDPEAHVSDWKVGLIAIETDQGEPVDTIPAPTWDFEEPRLMAQLDTGDGTNTSITGVPFAPSTYWAFSPLGHMVGGLSTRYAIDQYLPDGTVLRVERRYEPVRVEPGERSNREDVTRWSMRQTQPDWTWNGPSIPDRKPPFRSLAVGLDGRIWVLLHRPAAPVPQDQLDDADDGPNSRPADRWREPIAFDVFEPGGTYLGRVLAPDGFSMQPTPVFGTDHVWAVVRDELDVQYVVRFRIGGRDGGRDGGRRTSLQY